MWSPEPGFELVIAKVITRARGDALEWQQRHRGETAAMRAAKGTLNSGGFLTELEQAAVKTVLDAGARALDDSLAMFQNTYGEIPQEAAPWIRSQLYVVIDGMVEGVIPPLEEARRRASVPTRGVRESIERAGLQVKRDVDIKLGPIEFRARLDSIAAGDLPSKTPGDRAVDAFISYASEDRDTIARPLADSLITIGYTVWFDRYVLKVGDSLYRTIDRGLRQCRFGVVVLSPHFFAKDWPQQELSALAALADVEGRNKILPVWHEIDHAGIAAVSALMADVYAAKSVSGLDVVIGELRAAIGPPATATT